ncbi:MAG: hypothetical protein AABW83_00955 [Nanoarchaeota archaeon]
MEKEAKIGILIFVALAFVFLILSFYPLINSMQILPSLNTSINNTNSNYSVTFGGGTPFKITINEDTQYVFNFTINNSADGGPENLTDVNVTIPFDFAFPSNSNKSTLNSTGKDTNYNQVYFYNLSVSNVHHILSWNGTNLTSSVNMNAANASCCNVSSGVYLVANFSVATPGVYNLSIFYQFNNSATSNRTNITILVNDSTKPDTVEIWSSSSVVDLNRSGENISGSIVINVSVQDNGNITGLGNARDITHVFFNITNSSGSQNGTLIASNVTGQSWNEIYWNVTLNTAQFPDGQYNITIWANDSYNNLNNSKIITNVTVDNKAPTGSVSCSPATVNSGDTVTCTCSPTDGTGTVSGINTSATTITANPSTANTGTFTETCSFKDMAGNSGTASGSYTVEQGGISSGGGGGGSSSNSFYTKTIPKSGDLKKIKSIVQILDDKERIKIKINNEIHYVGVREVKTKSVVVEIESNPVKVELSVGQSTKVDLDNNKIYDVYVKLNSILNGKADLTIEYLNEAVPAEERKEEIKESGKEEKNVPQEENKIANLSWWAVIIVILILIIIIYLVLKKKLGENYKLRKYKKSIKYLSL